jgi:hypothetical protein
MKKIESKNIVKTFRWKNLQEAVQLLKDTGYFRTKQAEAFAFHLSELLESAAALPGHVRALVVSMQGQRGRRGLANTMRALYADLLEFTYHSRFAKRTVERLTRATLRSDKESDDQWAERLLQDMRRQFDQIRRTAVAAQRKRKGAKTRGANGM